MKPKFTYNLLFGAQLLLGLTFQVLFARTFGSSAYADVYFAGYIFVAFMTGTVSLLSEMFMQHYNEISLRSRLEAHQFYGAVFSIALICSVVVVFGTLLFLEPLIGIFTPGFEGDRRVLLTSFARILSASILITPLNSINSVLLNAEMRFAVPYALGILLPACNLLCLVWYGGTYGLMPFAIAPTVVGLAVLCVQFSYLNRSCGITFRPRIWHPHVKNLAFSSLSMRAGHQIYALKEPIAANFLSQLPEGALSIFAYATKIVSLLYAVTSAPIMTVYRANISRAVAAASWNALSFHVRSVFFPVLFLFGVSAVILALIFPYLISVLFGDKFTQLDQRTLFLQFLMLLPAYLVVAMEAPLSSVLIAKKMATLIIIFNCIFAVIFIGTIAFMQQLGLGQFVVAVSLFIAQFVNFIMFFIAVRRFFEKVCEYSANEDRATDAGK